jgi:hypothetical protein
MKATFSQVPMEDESATVSEQAYIGTVKGSSSAVIGKLGGGGPPDREKQYGGSVEGSKSAEAAILS